MKATIDHVDIARAIAWRANHSAHVSRLVENCTVAVEPSGSDVIHPEWWKDIHWKWLDTVATTGEQIWR